MYKRQVRDSILKRPIHDYDITTSATPYEAVSYTHLDVYKRQIKCNPENDYVNCYFHLFESAGEKAWQLLGLKNPIVTVEDLWKLEKELRNKYKNCKV